jgi:hypothetical protein
MSLTKIESAKQLLASGMLPREVPTNLGISIPLFIGGRKRTDSDRKPRIYNRRKSGTRARQQSFTYYYVRVMARYFLISRF